MSKQPFAPIDLEIIKQHCAAGGRLQLPDVDTLPRDYQGKSVDIEGIKYLLSMALKALADLPSSQEVTDEIDMANLLVEGVKLSEDSVLIEEVFCWEIAAGIFKAISDSRFVTD